jgi:type I restriction enzyme S subunit
VFGDWIESKDQDPDGEVRLIQIADVGTGRFIDKSRRFWIKLRELTSCVALHASYLSHRRIVYSCMSSQVGRRVITAFLRD